MLGYPNSDYAASLNPGVRERAATRLFLPPRIGANAIRPALRSAVCPELKEVTRWRICDNPDALLREVGLNVAA